jgi:aminoglycoside phosphotransferase (APT) family kinase protein
MADESGVDESGVDESGAAPPVTELQTSSRDRDQLASRLEAWLGTTLPAEAAPRITDLSGTAANGMSSETLLFDAEWTDHGLERHTERLVARLSPSERDVPVFPSYDLGTQFSTIRRVAELTDVPVPPVRWWEPDPAAIGSPFFVMDRVDGRVPPDILPYNFGDSWLYDAGPDQQQHLQDATVAAIAGVHAIDRPAERFAELRPDVPGGTALRRRVAVTHDWYDFAAGGGYRSSLVERALAWLGDHWPDHEGDTVLSWGDSRIGNVIYDGFDPVALLDWEMVGLGPRELDVAWLIYGHRVFEDIAAGMGLEGMPGFLRADDVGTTYESLTGHGVRDLAWYGTYAAVQYAIVFLRVGARQVHFGEATMPDDVDDLIMNREPLERMLAGTYWS